jgi:hypothetical protein
MFKDNLAKRKTFVKRLPTGKVYRGKLKNAPVTSPPPKLFETPKSNRKKRLKKKAVIYFFMSLALVVVGVGVWNYFRLSLPNYDLALGEKNLISPLPVDSEAEPRKEKSLKDKIVEQLNPDLFLPKEFKEIEEGIEIVSTEDIHVVFSLTKEVTEQVTSLQAVLSRAKIDGKKIKRVDFRFDKLVVEYQ